MSQATEDYQRLVHEVGYVTLDGWTCVRVTGGDRAAFLNNLCTNNVATLQEGRGCEAFFTDVKGHVLAHTILLCRPDEILVWAVPGQSDVLVQHLDKYIIREDVELCDLTSNVQLTVITGKKRQQALPSDAELTTPLSNTQTSLGPVELILARCDWFGPEAVLAQTAAEAHQSLAAFLHQQGIAACDPEALEILRVENGTPYYGIDFDAKNLPQEINRNDRAIDLAKGCYLGQETVARIDALGHVNKLLVGVRFHGRSVPPRDTALLAGEKEVGRVTSAVWSPRWDAPLALAILRRGHANAGTILDSEAGRAEVIAPTVE